MDEMTYPLFPLSTVLFPGGPLPLRIFETRYLDMVSDCMRHEKPFGVCLIRNGLETGDVRDWHICTNRGLESAPGGLARYYNPWPR